MYPDHFVPACQLPQSPGVSPANALAELERCVGTQFDEHVVHALLSVLARDGQRVERMLARS